jgi:hypothetical protein
MAAGNDATVSRRGLRDELGSSRRSFRSTQAQSDGGNEEGPMPECATVGTARPETGYLFIDDTHARSDTFSYTTVLRRTPMVPDCGVSTRLETGHLFHSAWNGVGVSSKVC